MLTPVEEIKSKLDIVDLIQEYVPLKQSGANFKGLCPFHNEKTPSFMVSREKQFFKCFGCGLGGDIFTFLQKMENLEFPEALKILAEKAGVKLVAVSPEFQNFKTRLYDLHEAATQFYQNVLSTSPLGAKALQYLTVQRGLTKEIISEFRLGYAPESWEMLSKYLKSKGFSDQEIKQSGLVVEKAGATGANFRQFNYYDRFRDRLMFPIEDYHGNLVGFSGRAMPATSAGLPAEVAGGESAKYINTPQTAIYNKSQVLYGLARAKNSIKEKNLAVLVEGNMDVIASHQAGVKNAVACSGTSLTQDQIRILSRYSKNVALCFDADSAGIAAASRGIELLWQNGLNVKVIILPAGLKDPDELIKKSAAEWQQCVEQRINFMDYFINLNLAGKDLSEMDVKREVAAKILPWLIKVNQPLEEDHYLKVLSAKLNVNENNLREALKQMKARQKNPMLKIETPVPSQKINKRQVLSERLLALVIFYPEYLRELIDNLLPEFFSLDIQPVYKEAVFYYTKNNEFDSQNFYDYLKSEKNNLIAVVDVLKLLAESEYQSLSHFDLRREFNLAVNFLKREFVTERLRALEQELRQAEQAGQPGRAEEIMKEFAELSRELVGI